MSQFNLGMCYYYGDGVIQDHVAAVYWYRKAAKQGIDVAQLNLGFCFNNGLGIKKDSKLAAFWYRKAAEQDNATAQFNLGLCYQNGNGVVKDLSQAAFWYQKAAKNGDMDAKNNLKYCTQYIENVNTDKNIEIQLNPKQESMAKTGFHLQNCVTITFLYLLYFTDIIRNFLITDSGFLKKMFIMTLPLGLATIAISMFSLLFRRDYKGNYSGFWLILLLVIVYTVYVSTGFLNGLGMLIVNIIVAIPSVLFIFAVEDSDNVR